jgi:uncharacterized protein
MSRIGKAYETRFRALLLRLHARQLEKGVQALVGRARQNAIDSRRPLPRVLSDRYEHLRSQVRCWQSRFPDPAAASEPRHFLCDGGLGGLARWLRAAGYEAAWAGGVEDAELVRRAGLLGATLLTTDSLMMDRGVLRDGRIPALWLPPVLKKTEQLGLVFREFNLVLREPRCMRCGGELRRVDKESVRERIPPRTWRWIDDYFECAACGGLFWRGTHWHRILEALRLSAQIPTNSWRSAKRPCPDSLA